MTTTHLGTVAIGATIPGAAVAASAGASGINAAFPDIEARIAALVSSIAALGAMPPIPSFPDMVARAQANLAGLQVAITMPGLPPPPSIATAIAALTALMTDLQTMLGTINGQLDVIAEFQSACAAAGVFAVMFDGQRSQLGAELQSEVTDRMPGTGTTRTRALLFATQSDVTWSAMTQVFRVSP